MIDCVIPDHDREFFGHWTDLEMRLQAGRERTVPHYRSLLERAGFRMTRWVPTASPLSFVEAEAIQLRDGDHTEGIEQLGVFDRGGSRRSGHVDTAVSAQRDGLPVR